jgi:hypothetical protein
MNVHPSFNRTECFVKLIKTLRNVALAAMLFSAGVANAALYQFQLTGDYTASWQLNSTVTPEDYEYDLGFLLVDVEGNFPGSLFDYTDMTFWNAAVGGGLEIYDWYGGSILLSADGLQLYTGTEDNPAFALGTFALTDYFGSGDTYVLTVSDLDASPEPPADVPEPASVALLMGGLGLMAASRKRRQRK